MRHYKKTAAAAVAAAVLLVAAAGFLLHNAQNNSSPRRIIFIPKIKDEENYFWGQLLEGVRMGAMEHGIELTIVAPETEDDYEKQNELIRQAVLEKPDAMLITPSSYENSAEAVAEVKESGIPLVLVDSRVDGDYADSVVSTDNVKAGRVQGEYMKRFLGPDSRIALVCHVKGSSTALEREQGIREGLGEYADQIVEVVFCDSDYGKAYQQMNAVLDRRSDIDMVAGLNEYSAVGAARAVVDRGMGDRIRMVGFDCSLEEIRLLEEGVFEGIVIQNPYKMGYLGMEAAVRLLEGEPVKKEIDSDCKLVTKEEVFSEENQKLMFMFTED